MINLARALWESVTFEFHKWIGTSSLTWVKPIHKPKKPEWDKVKEVFHTSLSNESHNPHDLVWGYWKITKPLLSKEDFPHTPFPLSLSLSLSPYSKISLQTNPPLTLIDPTLSNLPHQLLANSDPFEWHLAICCYLIETRRSVSPGKNGVMVMFLLTWQSQSCTNMCHPWVPSSPNLSNPTQNYWG